jgi:hypothetical protein
MTNPLPLEPAENPARQIKELKNRGAIALGISLICVVFLVETGVAHQTMPSAASPVVWTGLSLVALVSAMTAWVCRNKRKALERELGA